LIQRRSAEDETLAPKKNYGVTVRRVDRHRLADGTTINFTMPAMTRQRSQVDFFGRKDVPEFEGEFAYFEMERVRKGPWMGWRIIRQVEPPK